MFIQSKLHHLKYNMGRRKNTKFLPPIFILLFINETIICLPIKTNFEHELSFLVYHEGRNPIF